MNCNVVYDDQLGRVQISATAITGGSLVNVERSLDQVEWVPVRGGTGVSVVGDAPTGSVAPPVSDYEFATQATRFGFPSAEVCPTGAPAAAVENFYRISSYLPESMLTVTGSADSRASTPDAAALDVTGDIDIRIGVRLADWTPGGLNPQTLSSKYQTTGTNRSWRFAINPNGTLSFSWSTDGTFASFDGSTTLSTLTTGFSAESHHALRVTLDVDNGLGNHVVTFYTADTTAGPWQQLGGTVIKTGTTSIFNSTAPLEISSGSSLTGQDFLVGDVTKLELRNGINGTIVASPDFTAEQPGTTVFSDDQGNVWTVAAGALIRIDLDPTEDPTILDQCVTSLVPGIADVWLKSIFHPFLNRKIRVLRDFAEVSRAPRGGVFPIVNRSLPIAVTDLRGSRQWALGVCTHTTQEATDLDVLLLSGDSLFLHVPGNSNLPLPSMHVIIDRSTSMLKRAYSDKRVWGLPLLEVAEPDDEIVGATSTWQTVLNTYATWQDVLNAQATWADLLTLIASSEDVFFP